MAKETEKKKFVDLTKVKIINVDGSVQENDYSKIIAGHLYNNAQNVEQATAAMELFKTGKCEYSNEIKESILNVLDVHQYIWPVRQGIISVLGNC